MASEKPSEKTNPTGEDPELDSLLDNALQDFETSTEVKNPPATSGSTEGAASPSGDGPWFEDFLLEAGKQLEKNFMPLFDNSEGEIDMDKFQEQFQKMAKEANTLFAQESGNPAGFSSTISETLKSLTDNSECLLSELGSDDISSMLSGLGLGGSERGPELFPFMQSMMSSFLSKDVLYPPIKEVVEKYPVWLEENKSSLTEKDYENYQKQCKIMENVCLELEKETDTDADEIKRERFGKVLQLMEEMQKLGQPPKELVGTDNPFSFDDKNVPGTIPGIDPAQCSVM